MVNFWDGKNRHVKEFVDEIAEIVGPFVDSNVQEDKLFAFQNVMDQCCLGLSNPDPVQFKLYQDNVVKFCKLLRVPISPGIPYMLDEFGNLNPVIGRAIKKHIQVLKIITPNPLEIEAIAKTTYVDLPDHKTTYVDLPDHKFFLVDPRGLKEDFPDAPWANIYACSSQYGNSALSSEEAQFSRSILERPVGQREISDDDDSPSNDQVIERSKKQKPIFEKGSNPILSC